MKIKVGNKIYDGEKEPVMVILNEGEKKQISEMPKGLQKYCVYPDTKEWVKNEYEKIRKWMET